MAAKLSQSIYWVESILSKCHEEGELLFFTIRAADQPQVCSNAMVKDDSLRRNQYVMNMKQIILKLEGTYLS